MVKIYNKCGKLKHGKQEKGYEKSNDNPFKKEKREEKNKAKRPRIFTISLSLSRTNTTHCCKLQVEEAIVSQTRSGATTKKIQRSNFFKRKKNEKELSWAEKIWRNERERKRERERERE